MTTDDTPTQLPWTPLITGVVGSRAYGLAGSDSDTDILAVAAAPTRWFHGLNPPVGKRATMALHAPDITIHEVGKFVSLCLSANPTVNELLWLPADCYRLTHKLGVELIGMRTQLLCAQRVRAAYLGYAGSQFTKLAKRDPADPPTRIEKHARHLFRLVHAGVELYVTGRLTVRMDPGDVDRCREFGKLIAADLEKGVEIAQRMLRDNADLLDSQPSALPTYADERAADEYLCRVRAYLHEKDIEHAT